MNNAHTMFRLTVRTHSRLGNPAPINLDCVCLLADITGKESLSHFRDDIAGPDDMKRLGLVNSQSELVI